MKSLLYVVNIAILFVLVGCSGIQTQGRPESPETIEYKKKQGFGSILGGEGLVIGTSKVTGRGEQPAVGCTTNIYLWKASLSTLSFMPLISSDATGGIILTDWYADPKNPKEQTKVQVKVVSRELTATGVQVEVYKRVFGAYGQWTNLPQDKEKAEQLKHVILETARQLRINNEHLKN